MQTTTEDTNTVYLKFLKLNIQNSSNNLPIARIVSITNHKYVNRGMRNFDNI